MAWSDAARIGTASVAPHAYNARSFGHEKIGSLLVSAHRPAKIFILVLESWGESAAGIQRVATDVRNITSGDQVSSGFTDYSGPTLSGEIRELCGQVLSFTDVQKSLGNCLPRTAMKLGYVTTSLHGYDGYFYNRTVIYPQIGFERSWFKKDFGEVDHCFGAFDGVCDDVVLERAVSQLRHPGLQFVYMMSLSAHEPIDDGLINRGYIKGWRGNSISQKLVNNALIFLAVAQLQKIAVSERQRLLLYMVGDHNPPGDNTSNLPLNKVPYVMVRWN